MKLIGNLLWFILGGFVMGLAWGIFGLLAFVTIVGIPWGRSSFNIAKFSIFPFGQEAISRKELTNKEDLGTGGFGAIGNILWFVLAGFWLAIGHLIAALVCFVTIIGIPFGIQHLKLAGVSLFPIGKVIVSKEIAKAALEGNARAVVRDKKSKD